MSFGTFRTGLVLLAAGRLAAPFEASAQSWASDSSLTLRRALSLAEAHAPRLKARSSEVAGAHDAVLLSNSLLLPTIDIGGQALRATDNNITGAIFPQTVILPVSGPVRPTANGTLTYGSAYGVAVSWAPITFGRVSSQRHQASALLDVARDNLGAAQFDETVQVAGAFLDLLTARELVAALEQALTRTETTARSVRVLAASGLRPGVDSLLATSDVSRSRIDLLAARRNATNVEARLAELLGATDALPVLDGRPFLQTLPAERSFPTSSAYLDSHPRLRPFAAQAEVSRARQSVALHAALPRLSLVAGASVRGSGIAPDGSIDRALSGGFAGNRTNLAVGLVLSMNVLDLFLTGPRTSFEQARAESDRFELEAQQDRVRAQVTAADSTLSLALAAANEVAPQLAASRAGYQQMNSRYGAGLATVADLAQAQYLLTRAETDAVVTRLAAWRALLDQCAARGDLAPFLGSLP